MQNTLLAFALAAVLAAACGDGEPETFNTSPVEPAAPTGTATSKASDHPITSAQVENVLDTLYEIEWQGVAAAVREGAQSDRADEFIRAVAVSPELNLRGLEKQEAQGGHCYARTFNEPTHRWMRFW